MGTYQGTNRAPSQRKSRKLTNESRESSKTYRENNPENNSNGSARNESNGNSSLTADKLARGLGWFSLGLGAAQLLAPRTVAKIAGVNPDENQSLIRLFGLRELASGVAIFMQGDRPAEAVWSRVAGDALDLASFVNNSSVTSSLLETLYCLSIFPSHIGTSPRFIALVTRRNLRSKLLSNSAACRIH
jgi:hypothetical protein